MSESDSTEYALVPKIPTRELLNRMAMRYRHDFGILPKQQQETIIVMMSQIHEEIVLTGFYNPDKEKQNG